MRPARGLNEVRELKATLTRQVNRSVPLADTQVAPSAAAGRG